jgi:hypothetical protein
MSSGFTDYSEIRHDCLQGFAVALELLKGHLGCKLLGFFDSFQYIEDTLTQRSS